MTGRRVAVSTQEQNPRSAVTRTVVVAILALLPVMNATLGIIVDEFAPYGGTVPGWVFATLNGGIVATTVLLGILARILATPGVNDWLRRYAGWLSPEDKAGKE